MYGNVEVDEALVGGVDDAGKRDRGVKRWIVLIVLEFKAPLTLYTCSPIWKSSPSGSIAVTPDPGDSSFDDF